MNTHFILLRRATGDEAGCLPLDQARCARLLEQTGVRFLDLYKLLGKFDAMLICQVETRTHFVD